MTVNKEIRRGAGLARLIMDSVLLSLAVCPNRACPIFLNSVQYHPCGCEHISLTIFPQTNITSSSRYFERGVFLLHTNSCGKSMCQHQLFSRDVCPSEGESPFCSWRQSNQIPLASAPFPPFPCVFIEAHGSFIFRTPSAASPAPVSPSLPWPYFACQRPNGRRALSRLKSKCGQISWRVFAGIGGKAAKYFSGMNLVDLKITMKV